MDGKFRNKKSIAKSIIKFLIVGTVLGQIVVLLLLVEPWYVHTYLVEVERMYGQIVDLIETKRHLAHLESLFLHEFSYDSLMALMDENEQVIAFFSTILSSLGVLLLLEIIATIILSIKKREFIEPTFNKDELDSTVRGV
jgi:hypothetical protein